MYNMQTSKVLWQFSGKLFSISMKHLHMFHCEIHTKGFYIQQTHLMLGFQSLTLHFSLSYKCVSLSDKLKMCTPWLNTLRIKSILKTIIWIMLDIVWFDELNLSINIVCVDFHKNRVFLSGRTTTLFVVHV